MPREDEDLIEFAADDGSGRAVEADTTPWKLLVVDDDEEVHEATRFALNQVTIAGRPLQLIHARSGDEAATVLENEPDVAVILLDVVMESHDAGLRLVRHIREELHQSDVRIILRTGQPGYAPELKVIRDYDINDYKTKAELTHTRLVTTLIAAIRSYEQLRAIGENRRGLELIIGAASGLMEVHATSSFAEGVLTQIASLLHLPGDGIVCAQRGSPLDDDGEPETLHIVAAAGRLASYIGAPLVRLQDHDIVEAIQRCMTQRAHVFGPRHTVLYLRGQHHEAAVFVRSEAPLADVDRQLVEVFAANVSSCFGNVKLVERLNYLAYHDPLTGLGNRTRFLADLAAAASGESGQVACLLDVDRFTDINNGLGHEVGDQLLVALAGRLTQACCACRPARVDADTFGLVGPEAMLAPERLFALVEPPFAAGEQNLPISVALGYCHIAGGESGDTLYKRADMALIQARLSHHQRHRYFAPEMETHTRLRLDLIRDLRRAFGDHRLTVWYQPQVAIDDGEVIGLEALVRWPGETDFIQPPAVFVPLAEESGLIIELGEWVLDQACATYTRLRARGLAPRRIAVNVSMPQFRAPDFHERVDRVLAAHDMPAAALELEITESIFLDEPMIVLNNLEALKHAGVHIAVDDFGTGYSSLGYLRQMAVDCMKIDRSFVADIDGERGESLAECVIALAQKLGIETVAEGVETSNQLNRLRELGCGIAQGYLCARPMPAEVLEDWLTAHAA